MQKPLRIESDPMNVVTVLSVSPLEADHVLLKNIFSHSRWTLYSAPTLGSAQAFMAAHQIPVVLCECELLPGTWKDMLDQIRLMPNPPVLVVTSRLADDFLWGEALNLGAYDVLAKPFDRDEVFRALTSAWRHWKSQNEKFSALPRAGREPCPVSPLLYSPTQAFVSA